MNMKFTDGMFEFPIRIYDGFSVRRAQKKEEELEMAIDGDWVEGTVDMPLNEYEGCYPFFQVGRTMEDVAKNGFDGTMVLTKTMGDFMCTWQKPKFKARLNAFADAYTEKVNNFAEEMLIEKSIQTQSSAAPLPKWRQWLIRKLS